MQSYKFLWDLNSQSNDHGLKLQTHRASAAAAPLKYIVTLGITKYLSGAADVHVDAQCGQIRVGSRISLGGGTNPPAWAPTYNFAKFFRKKCMKLRNVWP